MESRALRLVDGAGNALERSETQRDAAEPLQTVADPVAAELEAVLEMRRTGADPKALRRALRRIEELLDEYRRCEHRCVAPRGILVDERPELALVEDTGRLRDQVGELGVSEQGRDHRGDVVDRPLASCSRSALAASANVGDSREEAVA
jgi:hypothetical protein